MMNWSWTRGRDSVGPRSLVPGQVRLVFGQGKSGGIERRGPDVDLRRGNSRRRWDCRAGMENDPHGYRKASCKKYPRALKPFPCLSGTPSVAFPWPLCGRKNPALWWLIPEHLIHEPGVTVPNAGSGRVVKNRSRSERTTLKNRPFNVVRSLRERFSQRDSDHRRDTITGFAYQKALPAGSDSRFVEFMLHCRLFQRRRPSDQVWLRYTFRVAPSMPEPS